MQRAIALIALMGFLTLSFAAQYSVTPSSDWQTRLKTLSAGDVLTFGAGTYTVSSKLGVSFPGTSAARITVQGAAGATVIISRPNANQNVMDIQSGSYFTIQNIRFTGGSKGVRFGESGNINNAIFQNNQVYGTATTAITFNDAGRTYSNINIISNEIYNTGTSESECVYMGCSDDNCRAINCIIEKNYCHDTLGATSGSLGSGIQIKTGSSSNIIRNNVVVDVRGAGILIYDDYNRGRNTVYGNFIWRARDNGIQATAGTNIHNNIIASPTGNAIAIQANQVLPGSQLRNVNIYQNTIYSTSGNRGISVGSTSSGSTFRIINNAIFVTGNPLILPSGATTSRNAYPGVTVGSYTVGSATTELQNPTSTTAPSFYPKSTSGLISNGDSSAKTLYPRDYNCVTRDVTIGAYQYTGATNPGAPLSKGFKGNVSC